MAARTATVEDRNIAHARLQGLVAWNGNGLLTFLASTSKGDKERLWMEPLRDLCERIVEGQDQGNPVKLSAEDARTIDELHTDWADFTSALE